MNEFNFEEAKKIAIDEAKKYGKNVAKIYENTEYWLFEAEFEDGHRDFDDGIGSIYVSKKDGSIRHLNLWDVDFTTNFNNTKKELFNYFK